MFAFRAVWPQIEMEGPGSLRTGAQPMPEVLPTPEANEDKAMSPCAQYMAFVAVRKGPDLTALRVSSA